MTNLALNPRYNSLHHPFFEKQILCSIFVGKLPYTFARSASSAYFCGWLLAQPQRSSYSLSGSSFILFAIFFGWTNFIIG